MKNNINSIKDTQATKRNVNPKNYAINCISF